MTTNKTSGLWMDGIVLESGAMVAPESVAFNFDARALALLRAADGDPANADALEKEYAAESEAQAAQGSASAQAGAINLHDEGNMPSPVCQGVAGAVCETPAPTFADIARALDAAARKRIEDAERAIVDAQARHERERDAREMALDAASVRVGDARRALDQVDAQASQQKDVANILLRDDELAAMIGQIDAVAEVARRNAEVALRDAEAARDEAINEIKAARLADALEIQLLQQDVERLQAVAPHVAEQMQRAERAAQFARHAREAAAQGKVGTAERALAHARENGLSGVEDAAADGAIASAKRTQALRDLKARAERVLTEAEQIGAVGKIAQVERDAARLGSADKAFARVIAAAYKAARAAKHARRAQAQPLARHLEAEGLATVIGDGRIEAWRNASNGHRQWALDRVLVLRGSAWQTTTPRVPVVSKTDPRQGRRGK